MTNPYPTNIGYFQTNNIKFDSNWSVQKIIFCRNCKHLLQNHSTHSG